ncbi:unnamed protein product [Symbiodinium pilosum]|uniref:Uncharacterized protein n=1 Tax=Symbiodinium pilosum TaxID=2952 RepID=A0A812VWG9_SYMPI|nr:unnamed protein product [Symbiodinium pilosum]
MRAYEMLRKLRLDEEHRLSQVAVDEPEWDHLAYLRRSPSPCRLRTNGTMWPTRKGAWRSRAGGVYLPPEMAETERRGSASLSPARWMYPEEFNRPFREARRSPSYTRYDREEISCSSSSSSSSTVPKRRRKKRRLRSSSHETRPSPHYVLEASWVCKQSFHEYTSQVRGLIHSDLSYDDALISEASAGIILVPWACFRFVRFDGLSDQISSGAQTGVACDLRCGSPCTVRRLQNISPSKARAPGRGGAVPRRALPCYDCRAWPDRC